MVSVGLGEALLISGTAEPTGVSAPLSEMLAGVGVALTIALGMGRTGSVTSGQGEAVTLPVSLVVPQPQSSILSAISSARYTKGLFISILLSVFAELLSAVEADLCTAIRNSIDIFSRMCYLFHMDILKKNQILRVTIDAYSSDVSGVCRVNGLAVFVPGTIVGEEWEIRILKVQANCAYARGERLLLPSPERVDPVCPGFGKCGGCDCRHMRYEEELRFKLTKVNDALQRIGKQTVLAGEIVGSERVDAYRNKGILAVGSLDGQAVSGFYRGRSHQIIPVSHCLIQDELTHRAAAALTSFMNENGIPPYDEQSGTGVVRHVFCRRAYHGDDRLLCIVARKGFGSKTRDLVEALRAVCPELTGIVLNINKTEGNTVLSGEFYTLWGKGEMRDTLCGLSFDIAPQAFFQVNPPQAEHLYGKALEYAALTKDDLAFDLYCGAGTISLCLAREAGRVIGAEIVPEAVENAKANAALNGIDNAEFLCADAGEAAQMLADRGLTPKAIVVDPPRKGMREEAIAAVVSMQPERVVYVSCEPSTLARDILRFQALGYTLQGATAYDLFPRTKHVETVCLLTHGGLR